MLVVYASMTGNVQRFVNKLEGFSAIKITEGLIIKEPYVLITYTTGKGQTPKEVHDFLNSDSNANNLIAVIGSGNKNWGSSFCGGAEKVSQKFKVPLVYKFEMSGLNRDVEAVTNEINKIKESINIG